jgi:hypothetical protein
MRDGVGNVLFAGNYIGSQTRLPSLRKPGKQCFGRDLVDSPSVCSGAFNLFRRPGTEWRRETMFRHLLRNRQEANKQPWVRKRFG